MRARPVVRAALTSLFIVVGGIAPALSQGTQTEVIPDRRIVLQDGADMPGGDLQQLFNSTLEACVATCLANAECTALTYNSVARSCFPKGAGAGAPVPFVGALSGTLAVTSSQQLATAGERAASAKWIGPSDRAAALEQARRLGTDYPGNGEPVEALRALAAQAGAAGDTEQTIRWIGAAAAATDSASDWLSLAQWMASAANAENATSQQVLAAMNAAVNAWLRDSGPGTPAIRVFADLADKHDRGRDGLTALRQSMALGDTAPDLVQLLDRFESRYGLRVEETTADADAPTPRACVQMSEPLAKNTDLRSFVALPDPKLAVEVAGQSLCISGVTHGQELALTLRKGLPAQSGEVLARDVPLKVYIRDRTPQARFSGRAYLLPAGGDQGLTVRTVNTDKVDLKLYSMSDRNIVQALRDEIFGEPLSDWKAETFTDRLGETVWSGQADVATPAGGGANKVNEEVSTRLDIARAAGALAPGVYALTASVPDQDQDRSPAATQWFMISDLGLSSYSGTDGLTVAVRSLGDASARAGVRVQLISRGNAVLGTTATDDQGIARFDAGLTRGNDAAAPAMLTAAMMDGDKPTDMAFLSLTDPEFDLSDRGVEGQPSAPPIDVFASTDRGAYRAGEVVHATILARNDQLEALDDLPLTAIISRPDGVEVTRMLVPSVGGGGHVLDWTIPGTAPRGSWTIDLKVDVEEPALASMRVLVEDFRPERLDLAIEIPPGPLRTDTPIAAGLTARWLYGAPGAELPVEGYYSTAPAASIPGWEGYRFGRSDAAADRQMESLPPGLTDAEGRWSTEIPVPEAVANASQPVNIGFQLSVREGAGRPVERTEERLVMPQNAVIGLRPQFADDSVPEGSQARFDVVALGGDQQPVAGKAGWVLNKIDTDYQWYALDGDWSWEEVTNRTRVTSGEIDLTAGGPAVLEAPVTWGEFELVVTSAEGAETSMTFWAGWGAAANSGTDTPDKLLVTLDKSNYRPGETARVTLDAISDGVAVVSVLTNRVVAMQTVLIRAGQNSVDLPVTNDWGAGAYVAVSAIRPLGSVAGGPAEELIPTPATSGGAGHAPIRALGIVHAAIDPGARRLNATLTAPAETRPRQDATVRLAIEGAAPGEVVHATIAAVDQGILNLTRFTPPDPDGHYFGQQRLGVGIRDVYGRLILASGAADGAIRSGGSGPDAGPSAPPPTEKLMSWFSGPLTVGADGTVEVNVPLPDFNGEVRLMAVAWTGSAVGQADATMLVRDPVVVTVTAPAFLSPGDSAQVSLALTHVSGAPGDVGLTAEVASDGPALTLAGLAPTVALADKGRGEAALTITAPETEGVANLRVSATLPGGAGTVTKDLAITVERQDPSVTRATRLTLAPGESQTFDASALGTFRSGTGTTTLTSGAFAQLDVGAALVEVTGYPYGCTEQLASAAMPLIYLPDLAQTVAANLPVTRTAPRGVDEAIAQILTRQTSSGAFGLWQANSGDQWLDAYATDFLSRARAAGFTVPDEPFRRALTNLQNNLNSAGEPQYADGTENAALAYAAYVLARERVAVVSDLRYYVDTAGDAFSTPMAAAQLGAALAAYGDVARADAMFRRAQTMIANLAADPRGGFRADYGTSLRDTAAALALATEAGSQAVDRTAAATSVARMIADRQFKGWGLSTQEALWTVLAGHALQAGPNAGNALSIDGTAVAQPLIDLGDPTGLLPLSMTNGGAAPLDVTLSATAVPVEPPSAGGNGWSITRRYFTPEGQQADPAQVAQGTKLVVVLDVAPLGEGGGRLMVSDPLPAGFEIDNPNLIASGEVSGLDWLDPTTDAAMTEFRQDRFSSAVTLQDAEPFQLAYRVRAVSTGRFHHPAAVVEDMYRPERRGWTDSGQVEITR